MFKNFSKLISNFQGYAKNLGNHFYKQYYCQKIISYDIYWRFLKFEHDKLNDIQTFLKYFYLITIKHGSKIHFKAKKF